MNIGFIGFGKMAQAMCSGISTSHLIPEKNIFFTDKHDIKSKITSLSLEKIITRSDIIFLCVKPQNLEEISSEIRNFWPQNNPKKHLISILAGKTLTTLESLLGEIPITRVMPNTPAMVMQSMSAFSHNAKVSNEQKKESESILESFGKTLEIHEELMDIVTAVSGSGPAFFYRIANSIAKIAENKGLSDKNAITLIAQTLIGAGHMMLESGKSPEMLIEDVSSPNGTTVAGLKQMENSDLNTILKQTIESAYHRSKTLSQEEK